MNVIGFDYGNKKIGIAVGQSITETANPIKTVTNNGAAMAEITRIVEEWQPRCFVVGEPKLADGKSHPLEKDIQSFINALNLRYNRPIYREDETLTSYEASAFRNFSKGCKDTDAFAAAIILESWIRNNINILKGE